MKAAFYVFLAILPTRMIGAPSAPEVPPADPTATPAIQLPQVDVIASPEKKTTPIFSTNPLFDHPYADLRSGPMIEAIFWRHKYLKDNPAEQAVIVTTHRGSRILSATTVYTRRGKVYGSSNALGERFPIKGVTPTELGTPAGIARISDYIVKLRAGYLGMGQPPPPADPGDTEAAVIAAPTLGAALVAAEESGDYALLGAVVDSNTAFNPIAGPGVNVDPAAFANDVALIKDTVKNVIQPFFPGPSHEILRWTYEALHNEERAGIVPVTLGWIKGSNTGAAVPPFAAFTRLQGSSESQRRSLAPRPDQFIAFDWDGVQYYYHPDVGTWAQPLPINSLTGLPDLCIRHGALIECVYFCAVFGKQHPDSRPELVPGDPVAVAYRVDGKLGLFVPTMGGFTLPSLYVKALDDRGYLRQIRDQVVAAKKTPGKAAAAIPEELGGDDGDLQMRRAYLAFQAVGIPCQLDENRQPSLAFTWQGIAYAYGPDQQILSSVAALTPKSPTALAGPAINLMETKSVLVAEPMIPDSTPDLPELKVTAAPEPTSSLPADATGSAPAAGPPNNLVVMPPFVVATTRVAKNPWRYASLPGYEILSRASPDATGWDLDGLRHGLLVQKAIIPPEWLPDLPVPCTVIIDDTNLATIRTNQPHSHALKFAAPPDPLAWGELSGRVHDAVEPISTDGDTFAGNSNVHGVDIRGVTYDSINLDRLLRNAPPLPAWVISGLLGREGLFREGFLITVGDASSQNLGEAHGPGTLWISPAATQQLLQQLKRDKNTRIPLLPLAELFAETPPAEQSRALWESEAGLFLRWGLLGPGQEDHATFQAFRTMVRQARREPVTEKLFTDCFGFGYAAMEDKLEAFLKMVLGTPTHARGLGMPYTFDPPRLRIATADEIGRILGDWIRMQGETLRPHDPQASRVFLDAAGQMLLRAYRDDNALSDQSPPDAVAASLIRDPRLLAVYGLYEHDAGNDAKAREFLEAAVKADVVRPRAYQVLAELRYAEAVAKPQGTKGTLSAAQAASIVEPLKKALRFPASLPCYELMVATWGRCEAKAAPGDTEMLAAGAALFPRSLPLAFKAALVCARAGNRPQADRLVRQGLQFATEETDRSRFEQLRAILEKTDAAGP